MGGFECFFWPKCECGGVNASFPVTSSYFTLRFDLVVRLPIL